MTDNNSELAQFVDEVYLSKVVYRNDLSKGDC